MNNMGHPGTSLGFFFPIIVLNFLTAPGILYQCQASFPVPSYKEFDQANAPAAALEIHFHVCTKATLPQAAPSQ